MRKVLVLMAVVALGFGGAGFALGATSFARAREERAPLREAPIEAPVQAEPRVEPEPVVRAEQPEAQPRPERTTATAPERAGELRVRRLILTTDIESHEPVDDVSVVELEGTERLYAFVDAANRGEEPAELVVTFEPARGEPTGHVTLDIPAHAGRFRTWAYTRHLRAGEWRAVVSDAEGREIASVPFEVR